MSSHSVTTKATKPDLCIFEEQGLFRKLYESVFSDNFNVELIDIGLTRESLNRVVSRLKPDVLLISVKRLGEQAFESLSELRLGNPRMGIVLLISMYSQRELEEMRSLASVSSGGLALYLKESLDLTDHLIGVVKAVQHGQIVLDPMLSTKLLSSNDDCSFLRQMTAREREIMHLMADGYTNAAIAKALIIDLKTVEHHINNMYSKLKSMMDFDQKHPRVQATRIYLEATGDLPQTSNKYAE
jgi:DNA-binding NarL/FixJ family response regulator